MNTIEAIRAEIKQLEEIHERNLKKPMERGRIGFAHGVVECCDKILDFIDALSDGPDWEDEYRNDELITRFAFYQYKDEPDILYLSNVFVEESNRNRGLGRKILRAAEKAAVALDAKYIRLKVKKDSPAYIWYCNNGYEYMTSDNEVDWLEKPLKSI